MISEINVFDQTVNNDRKTVYTLDQTYFKEHYRL